MRPFFVLEIVADESDRPKDAICQKIDNYIRDRIIIADEVIQDLAGKKIKDGDVILTHARSGPLFSPDSLY